MVNAHPRKIHINRKVIVCVAAIIVVIGCYFIFIYKPSSSEFLELQRQEKALKLPKPWRRDTSDFGCQWVPLESETQCMRDISLTYEDTGLKQQITQSLIRNGWAAHKDSSINLSGHDFDKALSVYFESWNLYIKDGAQGKICAVLKEEYNSNYRRGGPWAVTLDLFGKTEDCKSHIG